MDAEILLAGSPAHVVEGVVNAGTAASGPRPGAARPGARHVPGADPISRERAEGAGYARASGRSAAHSRPGTLLYVLMLILVLPACPSVGNAACAMCIAPEFGEWKYRANNCSNYIPSSFGYTGNEAGIVEAVYDALAYCNSGFDETRWIDLDYPDQLQLGHVCGGSGYYPGYSSSFHLEDHNYRSIVASNGCNGYGIHRIRDIFCPSGTFIKDGLCQAQAGKPVADKNLGEPDCRAGNPASAGNPLNVAFANKLQVETDLEPSPLTGLGITRTYNSRDVRTTRSYRFGKGWHSGHDRAIRLMDAAAVDTVYLTRPDARTWYFTLRNGIWEADADVPGTLTTTPGGWRYLNERDEIEDYDTKGRLIRLTRPSGITLEYTYTPSNVIDTVTTSLGESLSYTYDTVRRIRSISDHTGRVWRYRYDANGNLEFVTYPDGTPLDDTDNPVRRYHYEDPAFPNALTGITDERGIRYATFEYDASGWPTASYHGPQTSVLTERIDGVLVAYDGSLRTVTNSKGSPSTYTTANRLGVALVTGISGPGCASCGSGNSAYSYDPASADLLEMTENGLTTAYGGYDANGNPGYRIEAVGTAKERRIDYSYDARYFRKIASITEPSVYPGASRVTNYRYDDFGNRSAETISGFTPDGTPVTRTTTWQYNGPLHQLTQIDGPRTDVSDLTTFRYYPDDPGEGANRARLREIEDATGALTRGNIQYTPTGKVASEDRPNGLSLRYTYYPGNDRLETLTETDGTTSKVTRWTYVATGEVESITTAAGTAEATTISFTYDDARRLTRVTDGHGNYREYILDTEGNREAENIHDSNGALRKSLTRTFDIYNRVDTTSQANESVDYDFGPDGMLQQQTDGRGAVTHYSYDALRRLLGSTQDLNGPGVVTGYTYDTADHLIAVTDPVNGHTTYRYDDLGNRLQTSSPDTGTTAYTYDAAGNLRSRVDALGQRFLYRYDALNRLTAVTAPASTDDILYTYDTCRNGSGRLCSVIQGDTTVAYAYDAFGNITEHQGIAYTYDAANRLQTVIYPSGALVTYSHDATGQVSQVDLYAGGKAKTLAGDLTYAPFGAVERLRYGNGAVLTQGLDSAYRLTSQTVSNTLDLGYTAYDANGNLESRTGTANANASFVYDTLNRLVTAGGVFGSRDYVYDLNGNRITLVSDGTTTSYGYSPNSNRLVTETGWTYTRDANGNTTGRLKSDGSGEGRSYDYNSHNRLVSVTDHRLVTSGKGRKKTTSLQDIPLVSYLYNGLGQRYEKRVEGSNPLEFRYGTDGALLAELDGAGGVIREYVYLNTQLLAVLDPGAAPAGNGAEIIIDNGDAPPGWTARNGNKSYGTGYLYSPGGSGYTVQWTPAAGSGSCEVYASWISNRNYSSQVPYSIHHNGKSDTVFVNQTANDGTWQLLGSYVFSGSGNEYIEVSDDGGRTTADAIRLVKEEASPAGAVAVYYVHNDHLGTPQVMTDEAGSVVWRAIYDPFGEASVDEDPDGDGVRITMNVRFAGQYFDHETGLHYNMNRYYVPGTGRYLTSDPVGIRISLNTYAYVDNQPINWFDLYGLFKDCSYWGGTNCRDVPVPELLRNGNFRPGFNEQDFICSGAGAFFQNLFDNGNNQKCLLDCCIEHDSCYEFYGCNESSWRGNIFGFDKPCQACNTQVKKCFLDARVRVDCGCS